MELGQPIFQKTDGSQGIENFMRGFALVAQTNARKAHLENQMQRMALQNEALIQRTELQREKFGYDQERQNTVMGMRERELALKTETEGRIREIAEKGFEIRQQEEKRRVETAISKAEDQKTKLWIARKGAFNKELDTLGIPPDALENTEGWKTDPVTRKLSIELSVRDKNGAPLYHTEKDAKGKEAATPIMVTKQIQAATLERLRKTRDDLNNDQPDMRYLPPEEPTQQSKVLDASVAKTFLEQAGGDKARARQLASEAGYTF